jgi:PP-loop superfamily ATP-utilizing enzyme
VSIKKESTEIEANNIDIETILEQLEFKIRKHVKETVLDERDDLSQEIKIKILEKVEVFLNEDAPGFFEFTEMIG